MDYLDKKKLTNTYTTNGLVVKIYKPKISDKERLLKDTQIKYDIINIIKDLTIAKK